MGLSNRSNNCNGGPAKVSGHDYGYHSETGDSNKHHSGTPLLQLTVIYGYLDSSVYINLFLVLSLGLSVFVSHSSMKHESGL